MNRRDFFLDTLLAGGAAASVTPVAAQTATQAGEVVIERAAAGKPHAGKVLAVVHPHADDATIFAAGAILKLIDEGYVGHLIRTSNDEVDSYNLSLGETVAANERDNRAVARALGLQKVFDLNYRNHQIDDVSRLELRARLIFLFRLLKVDTVFSYDPWGHYEENPDHYVTAQAVEAACWMAGGRLDYPEHFAAGLDRHAVREKYYFARGPQLVNRVVDTSTTIDRKAAAIRTNRTMIHHMVGNLRDELAARKLRLPALEGGDDAAIASFVDMSFRERDAGVGRRFGLAFAEAYHHIGPSTALDGYIARNAVPAR